VELGWIYEKYDLTYKEIFELLDKAKAEIEQFIFKKKFKSGPFEEG
jgi:hypothetical protein